MNNGNVTAFPSLAALRTAHNALLRKHQEQGDSEPVLADIAALLEQGRATGALLDGEQERWTAQSILDYWTATLLSGGHTPPDALLADFDPQLAPELPGELCPYVGLDAFRETTSNVFFGRERLVQLLINRLTTARMLAVVGPSGSGKSSLVLAGLVPALKRGAIPATESTVGSDQWRYAPRMTPGSDPLANLARVLQSAGAPADGAEPQQPRAWVRQQAAQLRENPDHLINVVNATGDAPTVLIVDQFEELFTLCADEAVRQAFANNLLRLTQAPGHRHTVVLTMRTDFESFIMRLPGFQPFFEQALIRATPLNAAELREAIEAPAEAVGLKFEAGIVDALLQDILGEPAALPLLQFTLLKLWEHRERNRITWEAYRRLGGGRLALARSADELYESLIPEEQVTARRILLRLVRPGDGLEVTSSRVRRDELYQTGEARDRVDRVLQRLLDARLLRLSEGDTEADLQVEVAHEALVRNWPRLVEWLEEEREQLRVRLRLTEAAEQWEAVGRHPDALLRGALLEEARRYRDLNALEAAFVRASRDALTAEEQAKEAARQHELEQARALAETERQRAETERLWGEFQANAAARERQRAIWLTVSNAVAGVLAVVAVLFAYRAYWSTFAAQVNAAQAAANAQEAQAKATEAGNERATAVAALALAQDAILAERTAVAEARLAEARALDKEQQAQAAVGAAQKAIQDLQQFILTLQPETAIAPAATPPPPLTPTPDELQPAGEPAAIETPPASVEGGLAITATEGLTESLVVTSPVIAGAPSAPTPASPVDTGLVAVIPDIEMRLFAEPDTAAPALTTLRAPDRTPVLDVRGEWAQVIAPNGQVGWIRSWLVTYLGDPERLPAELRYLVISDQTDVPFTDGQVKSFGGARGDYLLSDPNNEQSGVLWTPVGTPVTLLFPAEGVASYGSGQWYFVTLVDPTGENRIWLGYLPAEVLEPRPSG